MPYRYRFNSAGRVVSRASGRFAGRAAAKGFISREAKKGHFFGKKIEYKITPVERAKRVIQWPVRVTVGTGISVENKTGKGWVLTFTWSTVVLANDADRALERGRAWVAKQFGEVASRLTGKEGYKDKWALEKMDNFAGWKYPNTESGAPARVSDLGKRWRSYTVNGVEHGDEDREGDDE